MGRDKAQVKLGGRTLLERVLATVTPLFDDVMVSGRQEKVCPETVRFVRDRLAGRGPAIGLCAAMEEAWYPYLFAIACDMPFVSARLIEHLALFRHGYDVVVPVHDGRPEPLCAMYSTARIKQLAQRVERGERGLISFIEKTSGLRVRRIDEQELNCTGRAVHAFLDIDSAEALAEAEKMIGKWNQGSASCTDQSQHQTDAQCKT